MLPQIGLEKEKIGKYGFPLTKLAKKWKFLNFHKLGQRKSGNIWISASLISEKMGISGFPQVEPTDKWKKWKFLDFRKLNQRKRGKSGNFWEEEIGGFS